MGGSSDGGGVGRLLCFIARRRARRHMPQRIQDTCTRPLSQSAGNSTGYTHSHIKRWWGNSKTTHKMSIMMSRGRFLPMLFSPLVASRAIFPIKQRAAAHTHAITCSALRFRLVNARGNRARDSRTLVLLQ
jgi:hypothetical protein